MSLPESLFSTERVKEVLRAVKDYLRGKQWEQAGDTAAPLASKPFEAMQAKVTAARTVFDQKPKDAAAEMKLAFEAAAYRDARYASAGRTQLGRLAIHNRIRGAFEGSKIAKDHNIT